MRYHAELDGLRTLAVFAVIASHLGLPFASGGWMGVDVFFVLSGYLITALLLAERDRLGGISLGRFYLRRGLRLYPALLCLLIVGVLCFSVLSHTGSTAHYAAASAAAGLYVADFVAATGHASWLGPFGPTWSLAVEEQFYLLWPLTLILLFRGAGRHLVATTIGAAASLAVLVISAPFVSPDGLPDAAYYSPLARFWTLLLGCIVAILLHRGNRLPVLDRAWAGLATAAVMAALLLTAGVLPRAQNFAWEDLAVGFLSAALVWHLVVTARSPVRRALAWAPLAWIGRRSYGVYLYHIPVIWILSRYVFAHLPAGHTGFAAADYAVTIGAAAMVYVATIGIAALSYRFLELPFLRLKTRFGAERVAAPSPVAATDRSITA